MYGISARHRDAGVAGGVAGAVAVWYGSGRVIFFLRLFRAAAVFNFFQVPDLAGLGYGLGLGFWVVFTIIVSLTLTLTLIITLTIILP